LKEPKTGIALSQYVSNLQEKPSVVFSSGMMGWKLGTVKEKIPTISILHGTYEGLAEQAFPKNSLQYWRMKYIYAFFESKSAQNAHVCIANSFFTAKDAEKNYGIKPEVIELPIDTKRFRPGDKQRAREKLCWNSNKRTVLFIGNPIYSKGFPIVEQLARKHPEINFQCVCFPKISSNNSNIHIYCPQPQEKIPMFYQAADVLLFPSQYEGFGFVPLEALSCNCPVVASKVGIFHDFETKGATIVRNSAREFEKALIETLNSNKKINSHSEITKRFSFSTFSEKYQKSVGKAVERAGGNQ
jgi:glycosyltransferase involved in cell wall biosynthesis